MGNPLHRYITKTPQSLVNKGIWRFMAQMAYDGFGLMMALGNLG